MSLFSKHLDRTQAVVYAALALGIAALVDGCGAGYRPVVTPINPSGPAPQPTSLVAVVSSPAPSSPGVATIVDYSGDTIVAQSPIGVEPLAFSIDQTGSTGYTYNSDGTVTNFPVSSNLQQKNVTVTTLPSTASPVNLFSPSTGLWISDLNGNLADVFTGSPETFKLSIPVASNPVMVIGPGTVGQRNYVVAQGAVADGAACNVSPTTQPAGEADAIEVASNTVSARIPLGSCPVYAVQSPDGKRLFVLNRGGDATNPNGSISVINSQNNTSDSCTPFQNQNGHWITCHPSIPLPAGPVYAEYLPTTQQLIVANYDSNTVTLVDVPLDTFGNDSNTYTNSNCTTPTNPTSTYANCGPITGGFGTTYTIPVGANPASVTALYDGSRAYTANQADGTVTVVDLTSHTARPTPIAVTGHPRTVVSTQNSLYGKVYVASPDSPYLTIIRTDQDIVDATVLVQGDILDVRATTQNGSTGNAIISSRRPGFGQPCYMPGAVASYTSCTTLP